MEEKLGAWGTEGGQNAERLLLNSVERRRIWKIRGVKNKYQKS